MDSPMMGAMGVLGALIAGLSLPMAFGRSDGDDDDSRPGEDLPRAAEVDVAEVDGALDDATGEAAALASALDEIFEEGRTSEASGAEDGEGTIFDAVVDDSALVEAVSTGVGGDGSAPLSAVVDDGALVDALSRDAPPDGSDPVPKSGVVDDGALVDALSADPGSGDTGQGGPDPTHLSAVVDDSALLEALSQTFDQPSPVDEEVTDMPEQSLEDENAGTDALSGAGSDTEFPVEAPPGAPPDGAGLDLGGSYGDDTLTGSAGDDTLFGDYGNDLLDGGAGDDSLADGIGDDTLLGGAGNDTLDASSADGEGPEGGHAALDGGAGDDVLRLSAGDSAHGGSGADAFFLGPGIALAGEGGIDGPAALIEDFDGAEDALVVVWDDYAGTSPPELELRPDPEDPDILQLLGDGEVLATIRAPGGVSLSDIHLHAASRM